jgi:hypothetical protein
MHEKTLLRLKELFQQERELRDKWHKARIELEKLVDPVTQHVFACEKFWSGCIGPQTDEISISLIEGETFTIKRPKVEVAKVETYLPFGLDYKQLMHYDLKNT